MSLFSAEVPPSQRSSPANTTPDEFDEEHELALIELQLADDDERTWSPRTRRAKPVANLRRILAEQRRLYELRLLLEQARREMALHREMGATP